MWMGGQMSVLRADFLRDFLQIFLSLRDERRVVADQIMEARKAEEDSL
jgi:hypothetical protein